ncbi:MarR family transcriptional regulator [Heliobacterium undosum]|uniref:MarR family transcriptional regulator n=1 Tax=Heliomicrobium undosum TaxID=121734 RepID=A0A845L9C8_9FIRM|nr:MarR family transcriptional regulator [Heliomicrobium undosum]MZP31384.1 MarR family transcriptional regulator [Heliomicrobium undosum]
MVHESGTAQTLLQAFMQFKRIEWHQRSVLGYKPSEIKVLFCIKKGRKSGSPGIKASEISQLLRVTPPTVTQLIKDLEIRGLVERAIDRDDRRSALIGLTQKGEKVTKAAADEFVRAFDGLVNHLGEAKSQQLAELLNEAFFYFATKEAPISQTLSKEDGTC